MNEEQLKKLDKCYFKYSMEQRCQEEVIPARQLLGSSRFDLYAILLYIDHKVRGVKDLSFAREVYLERTRAITGLEFSEEGNKQKTRLSDFFIVLDKLIEDFQNERYDENRTLIPVDKNFELIDGAHRVSCAAYFNKDVKVLHFLDAKVSRMTSQYLLDKLMPESIADAMAIEALRWHDDLFMIFMWPKSFVDLIKHEQAKSLIYKRLDVVYEKEVQMTYKAIRNLMIQIYGHMDWVGSIDNDFSSTYAKADEVWSPEGVCRFLLVRAPSTEYVLKVKGEVREIFQMGLASVHSTDNMRETSIAVNAIMNRNSYHFLHVASPTKYKKSYLLIQKFKKKIQETGLSVDNFIIDSSMILAISGAREANDLDYYTIVETERDIFAQDEDIEEHDDNQKQFYDVSVDDLIISSKNHFYYDELKFVSMENLLSFKKKRFAKTKDTKDSNDIKILEMLLSGKEDKWAMRKLAFKVKYKRIKRKYRSRFYAFRSKILKRLGLYDTLKRLRDRIKK